MTASKPTVLYVDDEEPNRFLFKMTFMNDINVITVESALEALEKLKENPGIESVITDMRMPGMNGLEFVTEARKMFPKLQYYLLTGFDITNEIEVAVKGELIKKYFKKPFSRKEIIEEISLAE